MNRLKLETSPYLKQHENNPVDWYAWGDEALEKAKRENKPILLSVGYSACHWCHVMAHESFENPEIAALMNEHFVNIKVDREERPDLDQIYQNVAQAITRGGGWPLTVFLLPDQRPFFGGTYFPPEERWGRPGFPRLLSSLAEAYRADHASVVENAEKLTEIISQLESNERSISSDAPGAVPSMEMLHTITDKILETVDWNEGGFGGAPKFPNTMMLSFLWRMGVTRSREAVVLALSKMAKGGIFDQLGGGFSRYSVDERWAVPHFEKMLYDNGLLLQLYSEVLTLDHFETNLNRKPLLDPGTRSLFIETVFKTVEYLLREMEDPAGGFYAAQDADSEGEEGKFFVWGPKELAELLSDDEFRAFSFRYGVRDTGNFEHGKTVLFQAASIAETAAHLKLSEENTLELLRVASQKVLSERGKRIRPGLDDKLLISWNGLAVSGLVWAAHALEGEDQVHGRGDFTDLIQRARVSATRAFERCAISRLPATIQKGVAKGTGFLDDYAFLSRAALDLYRFGEKVQGLHAPEQWAARWMKHVIDFFSDPSGDPGYFFTGSDHEKLLQRPKSLYDQAIPSGTAVSITNLLFLSEILEPKDYYGQAEANLMKLTSHLEQNPFGHGELASAFLLHVKGARIFAGPNARRAISCDRDFAPHITSGSKFEGPLEAFKVCSRGVCQNFKTLIEWASSPS